MNRSKIRHALYRAKNGIIAEEKHHIYDMVAPLIPPNQSWATFATNWDVFYRDDNVTVIVPEVDYDFIHTTCLEKSLCEKNNLRMDASDRQLNAIQIVELNMLEDKMTWPTYNKTWGVSVDIDLKRVNTRLFRTDVNQVTEDMISASSLSDGAALSDTDKVPVITFTEPRQMTSDEVKQFTASLKKNSKSSNKASD